MTISKSGSSAKNVSDDSCVDFEGAEGCKNSHLTLKALLITSNVASNSSVSSSLLVAVMAARSTACASYAWRPSLFPGHPPCLNQGKRRGDTLGTSVHQDRP